MKLIKICVLFLVLTALPLTAEAAPPKSLGDLNKVEQSAFPVLSGTSGSKVFFLNFTEAEGGELWVTDGTPAGTQLVKDIEPGTGNSMPNSFSPATFGGQPGVYFVATTTAEGTELWRSDGTAGGTQIVADINPGAASGLYSSVFVEISTVPASSFAVFPANNGVDGTELWFSGDGTVGTTYMVADINPGAVSSNPQRLTYLPALFTIVFSAEVSGLGREPYYSNAAPGNYTLISNINPGAASSNPANFRLSSAGNKLVFTANNGTNGTELWQTDFGTTSLVKDFIPGATGSYLTEFSAMSSGKVMFSFLEPLDNAVNVKQYLTDGSVGGTTSFKNLSCLPGSVYSLFAQIPAELSRPIGSRIVFPCLDVSVFYNEYEQYKSDFWVSDGTAIGTKQIKDIFPGEAVTATVSSFHVDSGVVFDANDGTHGAEPWFTDGTEAGTRLVKDINPGEAASFEVNDNFLFLDLLRKTSPAASADVLPVIVGNERKVYYTDGTAANTIEIADQYAVGTGNSGPAEFTSLGGSPLVAFSARHGAKGRELFVTNGKKKGTKLLKNIFKSGDSNPSEFRKIKKGQLLFAASSPNHGRELWSTNGSKKGTKRIKDIFAGGKSSIPDFFPGKRGGKLFFLASNEAAGRELWITNGTKPGTKLLKDINPGTSGSALVADGAVYKNKLFFAADDGVSGAELWVSDGTAAGTVLFKDLYPDATSSELGRFTIVGDKLFFTATSMSFGKELWVTDGTVAGTQQVKDIYSGASSSFPSGLAAGETVLFFSATDGAAGTELWRSDGTEAGTFMIEDIAPGASNSQITAITPLPGDRVVFSANDGINGYEPWGAGASAGSAVILKDMKPGADISFPSDFYYLPGKGKIVFSGNTPTEGREIWITDGTPAGTILVSDIQPGSDSSNPSQFFLKGRKLFFSASSGDLGNEPFVMTLP